MGKSIRDRSGFGVAEGAGADDQSSYHRPGLPPVVAAGPMPPGWPLLFGTGQPVAVKFVG
jgi:hypothetical protein